MNNSNKQQRQSRWGASAASAPEPTPDGNNNNGGGGGPPPSRDRAPSQSRSDPRRRGYDTTDAPAPVRFNNNNNNNNRDDSRGRSWGDDNNNRRDSGGSGGGGRPPYGNDSERYGNSNERRQGQGRGEDRDHGNMNINREDGWGCMECGLDALLRDERCPRCGTWARSSRNSSEGGGDRGGSGPPRDRDRDRRSTSMDEERHRHRNDRDRGARDDYGDDGHYGPRGGGRRDRDEDDENGNNSNRRLSRKKSRDDTPSMKREWPPRFEASGASFIFDARSGMFYEPASDFFYDPKTKLYYGNKKGLYFRFDAEKKEGNCKFVPIGEDNGGANNNAQQGGKGGGGVPNVATEAGNTTTDVVPPGLETKPEKVEVKPKIAISLKTALPLKDPNAKSLNEAAAIEKTKLEMKTIQKRKSSFSGTSEINATTPAPKHAKDMDKWSERVKEMQDEDTVGTVQPASKKVKTTASGQPICVLCRRKFANLEKLAQHERLSALHKENLAKKAAKDAEEAAKKKQEAENSYRDRSKERRIMHGSHVPTEGASHAEAILAHSLGSSDQPKPADVIRPEETLNDANVGNKLLQKLGWKSGGTLGRNAGKDAPAGNDDVASNLKSDWERIESLAQRGGRRR